MAKKGFYMNYNLDGAYRTSGAFQQLAYSINTPVHAGHLAEYVTTHLGEAFNEYLDLVARAEGGVDSLHHVYEWNLAGVERARLWKIRMSGRGRSRNVTWSWRASKTTVPIPDIPEGPQGQQLKQIHVFVWKAPIMEYDMKVNIEPKRGEWLAVPTGNPDRPLWFTKRLHGVQSKFSPGGNKTTGQFTGHWVEWWTGEGANAAYVKNIMPRIEADHSETAMFGKIRLNKGTKTVRVATANMGPKMLADGRRMAEDFLKARDRDYIADARRREIFFGTGGEDFE